MSKKNKSRQDLYFMEVEQCFKSNPQLYKALCKLYKISSIPELLEAHDSDFENWFFTNYLLKLLQGDVVCFEDNLYNSHDPYQNLAPDTFHEIYCSSSRGYGRWNASHKWVKRHAMSEKAKKRRIDRGRNSIKFDEDDKTRDDLRWQEGYACKKYKQAKKALKKDNELKRSLPPKTAKPQASHQAKGKRKKSIKKPLRWWERDQYLRDLKKYAPDVKLAKFYNEYSAMQVKYFSQKNASPNAEKVGAIPESVPELGTSPKDSARSFVNSTTRISQIRFCPEQKGIEVAKPELTSKYYNSIASFLLNFGYPSKVAKLPISLIRARMIKYF